MKYPLAAVVSLDDETRRKLLAGDAVEVIPAPGDGHAIVVGDTIPVVLTDPGGGPALVGEVIQYAIIKTSSH